MATTITPDQIESRVFEALTDFGAEGDVTRTATFESLDVDSLDMVELAQIVEEEFGVEIKTDDMKDLKTVGDAIDYVVARSS